MFLLRTQMELYADCRYKAKEEKKIQADKPGSVPQLGQGPYHLSSPVITGGVHLPTLLHWAGTLKSRYM